MPNNYINNKRLFILPILSTILFTLYWIYEIKFFSFIGTILFFIPFIVNNPVKCLTIYYFLLPNISLFKVGFESIALLSVALLMITFKIVLDKRFRIKLDICIILILYILISFITYVIAQDNLLVISQDIRVALDIFLIFSICRVYRGELTNIFENISSSFIFGVIISSITGIFHIILKSNSIMEIRLEAINSDPNYFALVIAFSISLLLMNIYNKTASNKQLLLIFFLILCGLMSKSRGFFIIMSVNVFFFIYLFIFTYNITNIKKFILIILGFLTFFFMSNFITELIQDVMTRFTSEETAGGSGRIEIWTMYLNETFSNVKNFTFGIGYPKLIYSQAGSIASQHNLFIELFTGKGIIGTVIFSGIYYMVFIFLKRQIGVRKINLIAWLPCINLVLGFMFLSGVTSDIGIMTIFLGIFATIIDAKKFERRCLRLK